MFQAIDKREWNRLEDYFNEDVVYIRPGYSKIQGIDELRKFYAEIRVIASGHHNIERVYYDYEDRFAANVIGSFHGLDREGRRLTVRFCDAYVFVGERITLRESYFNSPAV
jgi:ketosteroid isomerase-like protein